MIRIILILTMSVSVGAFSSITFHTFHLRPLSNLRFSPTNAHGSGTNELLWELVAMDHDLKKQCSANDGPMTRDQLVRLKAIAERVVQDEKRVTNGYSLLEGILSGKADTYREARLKATSQIQKVGKAEAFKIFGFLQDVLSPKTNDGADTNGSSYGRIDSIAVTVLRVLDFLLLEHDESSSLVDLEFGQYPDHAEYPDVSLASLPKLKAPLIEPPPAEYNFSARKFVRTLRRLLLSTLTVTSAKTRIDKAETWEEKMEAVFSPDELFGGLVRNPLQQVPRPDALIRTWKQDQVMARQFFNGVNPVMISVCKDPAQQLSPALLNFFAENHINVTKIAKANRLLFADYTELASLPKMPHNAYAQPYNDKEHDTQFDRYFHAPMIVFELDRERVDMAILAIELDVNNRTEREVFSPFTTPANEWLMAKVCVTNADSQYHEFVSHLLDTHLTFEPHIIALHNTIRKKAHPLWDFFEPLTKDTLFLNWAARLSLLTFGPNSFADVVTSVGAGQVTQLIKNRWEKYDFFPSSALPEELAQRGFEEDMDFPGYYFREDGMLVWKAMGQFTTDFVSEVYESDLDVAQDEVLQSWAKETTDPDRGAVNGFPTRFNDRATLAKTMQTLWWICSGLHAAVNYPQYDYYAYTPNKPLFMRAGMDQFRAANANNDPDWIYREALSDPTMFVPRLGNIVTAQTLTTPSGKSIATLDDHYARCRFGERSYKRFQQRLARITEKIGKRNRKIEKEGDLPYPYLCPLNIPSNTVN